MFGFRYRRDDDTGFGKSFFKDVVQNDPAAHRVPAALVSIHQPVVFVISLTVDQDQNIVWFGLIIAVGEVDVHALVIGEQIIGSKGFGIIFHRGHGAGVIRLLIEFIRKPVCQKLRLCTADGAGPLDKAVDMDAWGRGGGRGFRCQHEFCTAGFRLGFFCTFHDQQAAVRGSGGFRRRLGNDLFRYLGLGSGDFHLCIFGRLQL